MYLNSSDVISILSIIINSFLIIYVASKIQNDINNVRFFKDYIINEIKLLKNRSCDFLDELEKGKLTTKLIQTSFISITNEHNALDSILRETYNSEYLSILNSKIIMFQAQIEENERYKMNFKQNKRWQLDSELKSQLVELRGEILTQSHKLSSIINNYRK